MTTRPVKLQIRWADLLITSGLAATIAALASLATEYAREDGRRADRRCDLAASLLQDDTLNPYLEAGPRKLLVQAAANRLQGCMKG